MNKKTFTLGIFGGGQLGKFLVQSAKKLLNLKIFLLKRLIMLKKKSMLLQNLL
jgi:phosphoribosylaminoimidazole carboxylase (NCAIR synthetase)